MMNPATVGIGVLAVLYSVYTLYARASKPENFRKLAAMQQKLGKGAGYAVHLIAYSVAPLVFGVIMIFVGSRGHSLF
jgi:hypothetical protein